MSSVGLNPQKRAYRQRRKDPSCDACRERKVKCDATETTACTECSARNHKCQFTKETNRRMSSIKQVQDLQTRIAELTQENSQLRTGRIERNSMEIDRGHSRPVTADRRGSSPARPRRISARPIPGFDSVRRNIEIHSRGIFDTPGRDRQEPSTAPVSITTTIPELPLRADFAHISRTYLDSIHEAYPILHWPIFQSEVDQAYTARDLPSMPQEWIGLFFGVLACGHLNMPANTMSPSRVAENGKRFYDIAAQLMMPWPQYPTIVHAQILFLLSLYATESGMKSVGFMWLASGIRVAQNLALNIEDENLSFVQTESRRRLWWSFYIRDRLTSLAANCPMTINMDDCNIPLPSAVEDRYIRSHGIFRPHGNNTSSGFLVTLHLTRLFTGLYQTLQSTIIPRDKLEIHEEQFRSSLAVLPPAWKPDSDGHLEPAALGPILTLQFARFTLFRRGISPVYLSSERSMALENCLSVAQETAKAISRTLLPPVPWSPEIETKSWQTRIAHMASNTIVLHLWRCTLLLCLCGEYEAALICTHLSTAIGPVRKLNTACGKNTLFFLEKLIERVRASSLASIRPLEQDEDLLAYASADMQSTLEHSWAWSGADTTTSPHFSHPSSPPASSSKSTLPFRASNDSSPTTANREWDGWAKIEHMIRQLLETQHRVRPVNIPPGPFLAPAPTLAPLTQTAYYSAPHNPVKRVQLAAGSDTGAGAKEAKQAGSNTSRISIANII